MIDTYAVSWFAILWATFFEAVVIGWVYGKNRIQHGLTYHYFPLYAHKLVYVCNRGTPMGDFWDAWWQQTYQAKSIVLGHVRKRRTT